MTSTNIVVKKKMNQLSETVRLNWMKKKAIKNGNDDQDDETPDEKC